MVELYVKKGPGAVVDNCYIVVVRQRGIYYYYYYYSIIVYSTYDRGNKRAHIYTKNVQLSPTMTAYTDDDNYNCDDNVDNDDDRVSRLLENRALTYAHKQRRYIIRIVCVVCACIYIHIQRVNCISRGIRDYVCCKYSNKCLCVCLTQKLCIRRCLYTSLFVFNHMKFIFWKRWNKNKISYFKFTFKY